MDASSCGTIATPCLTASLGVAGREDGVTDGDGARIGGVLAADDLHQRRLARPVLTGQCGHGAWLQIERDAVEHRHAAEALVNVSAAQYRLPRRFGGLRVHDGTTIDLRLAGSESLSSASAACSRSYFPVTMPSRSIAPLDTRWIAAG